MYICFCEIIYMQKKKKTKERILEKLLHRYRLVILNDETFEERISFNINKLNIALVVAVVSLLLVALTSVLIAFTPLREYVPGYTTAAVKNKATDLVYEVDSLETELEQTKRYFESVQNVLLGKVSASEIKRDSLITQDTSKLKDLDLAPSEADSLLRKEVEEKDKYNLLPEAVSNTDFTLFAPVRGTISRNFQAKKKHYGIDVNAKEGSPIKAVRDGTVIFSEWTVETGNVIILEHQYNLISVYKHNKNLLKKQGDLVKSGEVIARLGNTGELSDGAHLHFELWSDGYPVNPEDYINFN